MFDVSNTQYYKIKQNYIENISHQKAIETLKTVFSNKVVRKINDI